MRLVSLCVLATMGLVCVILGCFVATTSRVDPDLVRSVAISVLSCSISMPVSALCEIISIHLSVG